jgi:hypothetical protein
MRSKRQPEPVFKCPAPAATVRSARNASSVCPERCDMKQWWWPLTRAGSTVSSVSLTVPTWLSLIRMELATPFSMPSARIFGFVQKMSSPTNSTFVPSLCVSLSSLFSLFLPSDLREHDGVAHQPIREELNQFLGRSDGRVGFEEPVASVFPHLARRWIEANRDGCARRIARLLDGFQNYLNGFLVRLKVGSEAALVAQVGAITLVV